MRKILLILTLLISLTVTAQHQFVQRKFLQGIKPPLVVDAGGWLKFDGVNDYINFDDASFYNLSGKDFTFIFRVIVMRVGQGSGSRVLYLFGKGSSGNINTDYYQFGTTAGGDFRIGIRWGWNGLTDYSRTAIPLDSFNIENELGKVHTFVYRRSSNSFSVFINGHKYTLANFGLPVGKSDPFGNSYSAQMQFASSSGASRIYYNKYFFYDRALSDAEIINYNYEQPLELGMKGGYYFDAKKDSILKDYSSVSNNAILKNYTNTELGIPTASTNTVWISDVVPFNANTTTNWTAPKALITTKFRRGFTTVMNFTIVHKRAGVTLATHTDIFSSGNQADIAITMEQGDVLEIDPSSTGSYLGGFEIFY